MCCYHLPFQDLPALKSVWNESTTVQFWGSDWDLETYLGH